MPTHDLANVEVQRQRGVELIEHVERLQWAAISVVDAAEKLLDGLEADDGVHVGRDRNENGRAHTRHATDDPAGTDGEIKQNAVGSAAVVDDVLGKQFLRVLTGRLVVDIVADEVDGSVGAATWRREGADGSVTEFAGTEVERQQAVGGGVGEENLFAHGGESTAYGCDEAGLADSTREREDGEDGGASFFLTYRCGFGLVLAGLFENALECVPTGGNALSGVLKSVGYGGLRRWCGRRRERLYRSRLSRRGVEPRRAGWI